MNNQFKIEAVAGKHNTFTIQSSRNCPRKFLSVGAGCGQNYVDFWTQDDGSGRQHWTVEAVPGKQNTYSFTVGGRNCNRVHLSTRDNWDRVDLWKQKNNNNQWFQIAPWAAYQAESVTLPAEAHIKALGKTDQKVNFGSWSPGCNNNTFLFDQADNRQDLGWQVVPVQGLPNTFNIISKRANNCPRKYLSVGANCGQAYVDLWT